MMTTRKGYSEKSDGSMYLSAVFVIPENLSHRERFFESLQLGERKIVAAQLVHGTNIERVTDASEYFIRETDGLITTEQGIVLTITGADCFPVYFEDSNDGIVGLTHCGWRGILDGIIPKMLAEILVLGGAIENTTATIGPGICAKHFEIKEDILPHFSDYPDFISQTDRSIHVDLPGIIRTQLNHAGISDERIIDADECTFCLPEKYFSYRRDKPSVIEAQVAYIMRTK